jgi:outer membrane lipoprotein-sorting protein
MKNLILIITLFTSITVFAQSNKEAEKLVKNVIEKISAYDNFAADVSYTMVNTEMDINEKMTSHIIVSGDKYRVEMEGQIIFSDGVTLWTYIVDSEEVMVSDVSESEVGISPTSILTSYDENYKSSFDNAKKYKNSDVKKVDLKTSEDKGFQELSLMINQKNLSIEGFSVYDMNGNVFTYHIIDLKPDIEIEENTFTFVASDYPDVEIIDMR